LLSLKTKTRKAILKCVYNKKKSKEKSDTWNFDIFVEYGFSPRWKLWYIASRKKSLCR